MSGVCPSCGAGGEVGAPCRGAACGTQGVHFIPVEHLAAAESIDPLIGQMLGEHLVVAPLGVGGMGRIYLGVDPQIGLRVAIKVLDAQSTMTLERFRGEATALARLMHPNIVRLMRFSAHGGRPYLVLEYVDGGKTLSDVGPLSLDDTTRILRQILFALEAAHAAGVVHRDIKPSNIMVQSVPGEPYFVRLVDFGLAKLVASGDTTRLLAGTPTYMAPEQFTRRGIGPWTDLYGVGVLAIELLTGRSAFGTAGVAELRRLKLDPGYDPTERLADLRLPEATLDFFRTACRYESEARYPSAMAFRVAMEGAVAALHGGAGRRVGLGAASGGAVASGGRRPSDAEASSGASEEERARATKFLRPGEPAEGRLVEEPQGPSGASAEERARATKFLRPGAPPDEAPVDERFLGDGAWEEPHGGERPRATRALRLDGVIGGLAGGAVGGGAAPEAASAGAARVDAGSSSLHGVADGSWGEAARPSSASRPRRGWMVAVALGVVGVAAVAAYLNHAEAPREGERVRVVAVGSSSGEPERPVMVRARPEPSAEGAAGPGAEAPGSPRVVEREVLERRRTSRSAPRRAATPGGASKGEVAGQPPVAADFPLLPPPETLVPPKEPPLKSGSAAVPETPPARVDAPGAQAQGRGTRRAANVDSVVAARSEIDASLKACRCGAAGRRLREIGGPGQHPDLGRRVEACREPFVNEVCVDGRLQAAP